MMLSSLMMIAVITLPLSSPLPDILLVVLDDAGFGDVGYHNAQRSPSPSNTPFIDELAASRRSVAFSNFYSGASICTPSRAMLLTSRFGKRTGVVSHLGPFSSGGLDSRTECTFARALAERAGYMTGYIGKWRKYQLSLGSLVVPSAPTNERTNERTNES